MSGVSHAQGTAFTYQGRLNTTNGPANGNYDLTFKLWNASSGGSQIGSIITASGLIITNGLFISTLDFGGAFNGTSYWLEIGVRTNGAPLFTTLPQRQALTPTPYAITAENVDGSVPAGQLTGTLPSSVLSGGYANPVNFGNAGNSFAGNGAGLANVNALTLDGLGPDSFWKTTGNAGTTPGVNFLGTPDNQALEFRVNNARGLRIEPDPTFGIPNIIGGSVANFVSPGSVGNVIAGGGWSSGGASNAIFSGNLNVISGGYGNTINNSGTSTLAGGYFNSVSNSYSAVGGGEFNVAAGSASTVPGGNQNIAAGTGSFAAGQYARAMHSGTFVWADSSSTTPFGSSGANQFLVRSSFFGINRTNPVTGADVFTASSPSTSGYGGMYIDTAGAAGWPFYGYSQAGVAQAWTYLDASDGNKWKLNFGQDRLTVEPNGLVGIGTTSPLSLLEASNAVGGNFGQTNVAVLGLSGGGSFAEVPPAFYSGAGTFVGPNGVIGVGTTNYFDSYGVIGIANGLGGRGVFGEANDTTGSSAYGVYGQSSSTNGAGVWAQGAGSGSPALGISNGGIQVSGAGKGSPTAAFIVVSATTNSFYSNAVRISNPLCNGRPNAILIVTHNPTGQTSYSNNNHPVGVWYDGSFWEIFNEDGAAMPTNVAFNAIVFNP